MRDTSRMDTLILSRLQFAANISFHILFPTISIALSWFLVYFRVRRWEEAYYLWAKIFALTFALGVVSGITMSFQFGTNWPGYMQRVGNIAGPLLAYEVLTAFFLEATFLGVMLFGMNRVPGWVHVLSAAMVAIGTTISAFWILALNSWMHTPAGHEMDGSQLVADLHGLNTLEHQPAKIAAIEAIWKTEKGAPLVLFAVPDDERRRNDFAVEIPKGASLVLRHDPEAEVQGVEAFVPDAAPVAPVFFAFRVMVGMGVLMLLAAWTGAWATRRGMLPQRWMLWAFSGFTFAGWIATLAGWLVTEIGRQPWLVTGILRTREAVGGASGAQLGASLTGYIITYTVMLIAYLVVLTHLAGKGADA